MPAAASGPDLYYGAIRLAGAQSGSGSCREITPP